ncbi:MAG: J domain-containing protein [Fimbriimonas ginsengisoli]|uniref:J domain-containing protein n=1 Tax=Fimbriimonas ginsengisoli TaxID=1005039 RepID=A0A931PV53_FIMGI|nr:J domain-containing protein [Fimbriimonas ginsengisoli]
MARNHYEVLGVSRSATDAEIKSAYRRLALLHHPDRSSETGSREIFLAATKAYETLSDPAQRRAYDRTQIQTAGPKPTAAPKPPSSQKVKPSVQPKASRKAQIASDVTRMSLLYSRGQQAEAERIARRIVAGGDRQPLAHAILGDVARVRGKTREAARQYDLAAKAEPANPLYRRRHEEMLAALGSEALQADSPKAVVATGGVLIAAASYIALSQEPPLLASVPFISSWTLGLVAMTFLCGIAIGAALSVGGWLERFTTAPAGMPARMSPAASLGCVALISFWLAAALYGAVGTAQRGFNRSTSRLLSATTFAVCALSLGAALSPGLSPFQVLLWSGNLVYPAALCGWMVADTFKPER